MRRAIWILWPSFIVAGVAEVVFFTLFDPTTLEVFGEPTNMSRSGIYTLGFFLFWIFGAATSAFTCFLQRSALDINNLCPLAPADRPEGCPKRAVCDCSRS
jgi:hypothetical protein